MIALIDFGESVAMPRTTAENLGLAYTESRVGMDHNEKLKPMERTWDKFKDECDYDSESKKYTSKDTGQDVLSYYIYTRLPEGADYVLVAQTGHLVNLNTFVGKCRVPFKIVSGIKNESPTVENLSFLLSQIEEKTVTAIDAFDRIQSTMFNQKCNVHVGGGLIAQFNRLMLLEDACTDGVQNSLNNGWRIIAVCVQPNQRRPDYVLGRFDPEMSVHDNHEACRGVKK
jgi:hypothetical protein